MTKLPVNVLLSRGQDGVGGVRHDVDRAALRLDGVTTSQHRHGRRPDTYKCIELNWIYSLIHIRNNIRLFAHKKCYAN